MKMENLFEAAPGSFLDQELKAADKVDIEAAPLEAPPLEEPLPPGDDLGVTDMGQLGPLGGEEALPPPPPLPMDPGLEQPLPPMEPESPEPAGEPETKYGDWKEVDSVDQRDVTLEHPSGIKMRVRGLGVHPGRYLAQVYKGSEMIHSGKKDVPEGKDPIEFIVNVANKSLGLTKADEEPAEKKEETPEPDEESPDMMEPPLPPPEAPLPPPPPPPAPGLEAPPGAPLPPPPLS